MLSIGKMLVESRGVFPVALWLLQAVGYVLFIGSMVAACIMDLKEQLVYRFVWLIAAVGISMVIGAVRMRGVGMNIDSLCDLVFFAMLQQLWFGRFYGRADCHAFCISAFMMWTLGLVLLDYVMHMLLAFAGLILVQLVRRNVRRNGQLKEPVPLIPYIAVALCVWVDFVGRKWYI